jgi:hypothetical protein
MEGFCCMFVHTCLYCLCVYTYVSVCMCLCVWRAQGDLGGAFDALSAKLTDFTTASVHRYHRKAVCGLIRHRQW